MKQLSALILLASFAASSVTTRAAVNETPKRPVYVYLYSKVDDHLNYDITIERMRKAIAIVKQFQRNAKDDPTVLLMVNGPMSQQVVELEEPLKFESEIKAAMSKGVAEIGYDAEDEPIPALRPIPNFRDAKTPEDRFRARVEAMEWFLNEFKDPYRGKVDPSRSGALKRTQEVFGAVGAVRGITTEYGSEKEILHVIRRMGLDPVMFGLTTVDPTNALHGYAGSVAGFGDMLSPAPNTPAELFWRDSFLYMSETATKGIKTVSAFEGVESLKKTIAALDRSKPHIVRVELASAEIYIGDEFRKIALGLNPLQYAYKYPKKTRLTLEQRRTDAEVAALHKKEAELMEYLAKEFFPANPGSGFLSTKRMRELAGPHAKRMATKESLTKAAANLIAGWDQLGNNPPPYVEGKGEYFSLAELYQTFASSLAELHKTDKLPESVKVEFNYGPMDMPEDLGPGGGKISVGVIARICSHVAPSLAEPKQWAPVPTNVIPFQVEVDGKQLHAGQFLYLMAGAYLAGKQEFQLTVRPVYMFSPAAEVFPKSRPRSETGSNWTIRPVPLSGTE